MNILQSLLDELESTEFDNPNKIENIRSKNGVHVFRIYMGLTSYIVKFFEKEEFKREIKMYNIVKELGIKTLLIFESTNNLLIIEDINVSQKYRLGSEEDLYDNKVAKALASWYKDFHKKGLNYFKENQQVKLYSETDKFTKDTIIMIANKLNMIEHPVWKRLIKNIDKVKKYMSKKSQTLNYNDFYYTNLIVSKDREEAFMFDYNFMGMGLKYFDIRNVTLSLKGEAKETFLKEYGKYDIEEKLIDDITSVIIDLQVAYEQSVFPKWAEDSIVKIKDGTFNKNVSLILDEIL